MAKSLSGCAMTIGDFSDSDESMRATCAKLFWPHVLAGSAT